MDELIRVYQCYNKSIEESLKDAAPRGRKEFGSSRTEVFSQKGGGEMEFFSQVKKSHRKKPLSAKSSFSSSLKHISHYKATKTSTAISPAARRFTQPFQVVPPSQGDEVENVQLVANAAPPTDRILEIIEEAEDQ